ncbi:MAG: DUF547 domain-containing protein [Gammaproteobacteria bacterium]|nr:DUF547 domain-containing protein [Gammaproteobacteria bacterium]
MKYIGLATLIACGLLGTYHTAHGALSEVPEQFQGYDDESEFVIDYGDLTALLKTVVVDVGRSTRRVAAPGADVTGTRMKTKVKMTANEGNRFYFKTFKNEEASQEFLREIQASLEQLPSEAPLKHFSRDEQLAYWLNLYNVTVLNEVVAIYPKKNLKKISRGKKSIFEQKLLNVAGVPLSLNDIQYTILTQNYDGNPLIMYGLYQGIIGGPNIRKTAYVGSDVYRALTDNAREFVNSNRGTYAKYEGEFRASSFYDRNKVYFPNFTADLTQHLSTYLQGSMLTKLETATKIKANIDDWSVNDLGGSQRRIGGSLATSRAALLDSVKGTTPADGGGVMGAAVGAGSSSMAAKGQRISRIDPGLLAILHEINDKRLAENQRNASVSIEELEDDDVKTDSATSSEEQ